MTVHTGTKLGAYVDDLIAAILSEARKVEATFGKESVVSLKARLVSLKQAYDHAATAAALETLLIIVADLRTLLRELETWQQAEDCPPRREDLTPCYSTCSEREKVWTLQA